MKLRGSVVGHLAALSLLLSLSEQIEPLPSCQKSSIAISDVQKCSQGIDVLQSYETCQGSLRDRCCSRVNLALDRNCHCLSSFSEEQRQHLEKLWGDCQATENAESRAASVVRLFVGVLTSGGNMRARQSIRETWGSDARLLRVLFFCSKPTDPTVFDKVRGEASAKGDIVILPTIWEGYYNITHQTLEVLRAGALERQATHVLKVDDDSYVRVGQLLERIEAAPGKTLFLGNIENPGGGPHRNRNSQWYVTPEEWPSEIYPPWAHGAGYVISQDIVQQIAAGAAMKANSHHLFKLEDIAVASWVEFVGKEQGWNINYVHDPGFNYLGCAGSDVVSHYVKPKFVRCIFKNHGNCCSLSTLSKPHIRGIID